MAGDSLAIGWIGTGVMGRSMCGHLLRAGHRVAVHSRTQSRAVPLLEAGACWASSPAEAAREADVICSMVGYPADVRDVHLGPAGTIAAARRGALLIDFTTSSPALARELAAVAGEVGVAALDAPVSGGDVGARNATLSIMTGGTAEAFERARGLLETLGKTVVHHGPAGSGQHAKLVNQILIAGNMVGVCEALLYAWRSGLDPEAVLRSVSSGAAGSWSLSNLAPRVLRGDLQPGFYVEHFVKDMGLALEEAGRMGLELPGLSLARRLYEGLVDQGGARLGTQALVLALARLSSLEWDPPLGAKPAS